MSFMWRQAGQVADGSAFGPCRRGFSTALIGHLEGIGHVFLKPLDQDSLGNRWLSIHRWLLRGPMR